MCIRDSSSCGGSGRQCSERADNNQDKRSARQRPPSRGVARRMDRVPLYYKSDRHTLQRIFSLPQAERYVIVIYYAGMMELADMRDLGSRVVRRAGSTPVTRTKKALAL